MTQMQLINDMESLMKDAYLGIDVNEATLPNPLENIPESVYDNPEMYYMWLMSQPEYFYLACKVILNVNLLPFQTVILDELWRHKFPMLIGSRGMSKSFMLAVYILLRMLFLENRKIVIAGAGFRQSKVVFQYIETIVSKSPILKDYLYSNGNNPFNRQNDEYKISAPNGSNAIAIPIGTGDKIRGKRANDIIADEFASMLIDIFETVIAGFGAVSSAPELNVKRMAAENLLKQMGMTLKDVEDLIEPTSNMDNQIIISGTAYYDFNHFSNYHNKWSKIIKSRGNPLLLQEAFGAELDQALNWKDYSIIKLPYELLPEGFMDKAQVARSRTTMHTGNYEMEFGAVFSKDSAGFFKRSLINSCVVDTLRSITTSSGRKYTPEELYFEPMMHGDKRKQYVIANDPAAMVDNLSIVVLELDGEFRKVVHVWTTNKKEHAKKLKLGMVNEHNYYAYCARKIRELMKRFPTVRLAIDSEGGGRAIMEALKDKDKLLLGELPILHIIDHEDPRPDEDGLAGLHIIDEIHFADGTWVANANHGLKKDMEDGILLFPYTDAISIITADYEEEEEGDVSNYDTLNQCIRDIEELKNELSTIVVSETKTGRESWDTPEVKLGTGKKGRMRKDRYSSLLMANMTARVMQSTPEVSFIPVAGGFAGNSVARKDQSKTGTLFTGPSWMTERLNNAYKYYQ